MSHGNRAFGSYLKGKLQALSLSPEQMAEEIGIHRSTLYRYLAEEILPAPQVMERICERLGVPVRDAAPFVQRPKVGRPRGKSS